MVAMLHVSLSPYLHLPLPYLLSSLPYLLSSLPYLLSSLPYLLLSSPLAQSVLEHCLQRALFNSWSSISISSLRMLILSLMSLFLESIPFPWHTGVLLMKAKEARDAWVSCSLILQLNHCGRDWCQALASRHHG